MPSTPVHGRLRQNARLAVKKLLAMLTFHRDSKLKQQVIGNEVESLGDLLSALEGVVNTLPVTPRTVSFRVEFLNLFCSFKVGMEIAMLVYSNDETGLTCFRKIKQKESKIAFG